MAYITSEGYKNVIYSGDANSRIRIWIDDVELEDADYYCEKLSVSSRILPKDASKRFSLDNFVSKELTLILHNVEINNNNKIKISLGILVDNDYEDIPLGIFNIQGIPTTDKDKKIIKLRDNSVLFDFNYNGQTLIDENGGTATKLQILKDICNQANVVCNIEEFIGANETFGFYDDSITARTYISYLAEQAGAIPTINRDGELIFIYLNNLATQRIPLSIVEKYTIGENYKISRVVYEDAIRKFEFGPNDYDNLFLNSANPFISSQEQIQEIYNIVNGFEINSISTGKIIGDPAIDHYDLVEIYDDYVEDENVIAKTLANQNFIYNGVMTTNFDTEIGLEQKKENVNINSEATFKKWAKTSIDNNTAEISMISSNITTLNTTVNNNYQEIVKKFDDYIPQGDLITVENTVKQLQTDTYTKTEINTKLTDGSVTKVLSTAGTFDENGLTIEKTNAKTKGNFNETGVTVMDATGSSNTELLFAGYDENLKETIVRSKNMNVTKYFTIGKNSRMEDYEDGTGVFYIGG